MDFESRHMIEALRSGVPSRSVGSYFCNSRAELINTTADLLDSTCKENLASSLVIVGKYGEGKTHYMNTALNMGFQRNMVVSFLPLSKETPGNNMSLLYKKLLENTFLPNHTQPGIENILEDITPQSMVAKDMLLFAHTEMDIDRLYYVFKAFLETSRDSEEHMQLLADLMGNFVSSSFIKQTYEKVARTRMSFKEKFTKSKNSFEYFKFMSYLFKALGYNGWLILFDEAELIGRLSKNARKKTYINFEKFLNPDSKTKGLSTIFAFSTSFYEEVIENKNEEDSIESSDESEEDKQKMIYVLDRIKDAYELKSLTEDELVSCIYGIVDLYEKAYDYKCPLNKQSIYSKVHNTGFLLRTKVRACIEILDRAFLFNDFSDINVNTVSSDNLEGEQFEDVYEKL